jgi:PAS domain-containing protein
LSFVIIAIGVLCAWGTAGPLGVLVAPSLGGMLSRRALPIAALLPLLAGWFSINGDRAGRFEVEFAFAFVALVNTVVSAGLGVVAGVWLHRLDARRASSELELRKSEQHFRALAESLPGLVWTCRGDGPCDYLSPQWIAYTGRPEHGRGRHGHELRRRVSHPSLGWHLSLVQDARGAAARRGQPDTQMDRDKY